MSYVFDDSEKRRILDAVRASDGVTHEPSGEMYQPVDIEGRHCAPFYQVLSDLIGEKFLGSHCFDRNVKAT
jgi:hypothetical protein